MIIELELVIFWNDRSNPLHEFSHFLFHELISFYGHFFNIFSKSY